MRLALFPYVFVGLCAESSIGGGGKNLKIICGGGDAGVPSCGPFDGDVGDVGQSGRNFFQLEKSFKFEKQLCFKKERKKKKIRVSNSVRP